MCIRDRHKNAPARDRYVIGAARVDRPATVGQKRRRPNWARISTGIAYRAVLSGSTTCDTCSWPAALINIVAAAAVRPKRCVSRSAISPVARSAASSRVSAEAMVAAQRQLLVGTFSASKGHAVLVLSLIHI